MNRPTIEVQDLDPKRDDYAKQFVDRLLQHAIASNSSDIHLTQSPKGTQIRVRCLGRLQELGTFEDGTTATLVNRLKALAGLVTYRSEIPQEGRLVLKDANSARKIEARVSTIPTLHGERLAIRLVPETTEAWKLQDLGLPPEHIDAIHNCLGSASGVFLIAGAAGTGKTTTAYAALREILASSRLRSIVSLEDPIECELEDVAQSQVRPDKDYGWSAGLRALLRQDPEIMLVGEIRDAETAQVVFQAAMTGQLVLTTMHARSTADALCRLLDMEVPVQQISAALNLAICQRLIPLRCECQQGESLSPDRCSKCGGSGSSRMQLLVELLPSISGRLKQALMAAEDSSELQSAAISQGMQTMTQQIQALEDSGKIAPSLKQPPSSSQP
ncbi:MAG: ATPase, T2SS/T4P/T4SS family [Planctomycetota bacterium]